MHLFGSAAGQTPVDPDQAKGLVPSWISTHADLNLAEAENIAKARQSMARRRLKSSDILSEPFVRGLHRRMFRDVWKWAGTLRTTEMNIGVDHWLIRDRLAQLLDDVAYWIENQVYEPDELAVRFHHRLVSIHPFPNGNGRLSREIADLLAVSLGRERFSWSEGSDADSRAVRDAYIRALQAADGGEIDDILRFARMA